MTPDERAVLLSIRPKYVSAILDGRKTVELRRTKIHAPAGAVLVLYGSSPSRSVLGTATLEGIDEAVPSALWPEVRARAGVTRREFNEYFRGARSAFALRLRDVVALTTPVPLGELRSRTGLEPPQSFRYVTLEQVESLTSRDSPAVTTALTGALVAAADQLDLRPRARANVRRGL